MFEEMKIASILDKLISGDPTSMPPSEVLDMATINAAQAFDLNCGEIKEGKLADLILINLKSASMTPLYHTESNLVYSMNGYNVDTTICDGKILMQNGVLDYSWSRLYDDYRLCVSMGVYVATEYCRGGINERWTHVWLRMLQRALTACDDLDCQALWRE